MSDRLRLALLLSILALAVDAPAGANAAEPMSVLWPIVQYCMAPQHDAGDPACFLTDRARGYALLKDIRGPTQVLLVATDRRWGMEDPRIEAPDAPNYFAAAWAARRCVSRLAGREIPDGEISLAINSMRGRSDGQLHIHIDRVRPEVEAKLAPGASELTYSGHRYAVRHIDRLSGMNLFAAEAARAEGAIGEETIVVAGDPRGGFYVLTDHVGGMDRASGEELQVEHPKLSPDQLRAISIAGCAEAPS
ncbi:MAG TPA: CDP-diacylglycerol diphosphatase [Stellaceae bacterium]|nr:CDP-diacylglycerol diphosphatase [Stellaceae bacterium]